MILKNISIRNFRNISELSLSFNNNINFFYGNNGAGKSNILEAIHYLINVKSFRDGSLSNFVKWNENGFFILGEIECINYQNILAIEFFDGKRTLKKNSKIIRGLSEYQQDISSVTFCPNDIELVKGEPKERRRFFDRAIYSINSSYLDIYLNYYKVLKNKNRLLIENHTFSEIEPWIMKQSEIGVEMYLLRLKIVKEIIPIIQETFNLITKRDDVIDIIYTPTGIKIEELIDTDPVSIKKIFVDRLKESYEKEKIAGFSIIGPHRDFFDIFINGKNSKNYCSQGESKSITLSFKLAEIINFKEKKNEYPIVIIDDFSSEIDNERKANLLNYLEGNNIQLFMSATSKDEMNVNEKTLFFYIENGGVI